MMPSPIMNMASCFRRGFLLLALPLVVGSVPLSAQNDLAPPPAPGTPADGDDNFSALPSGPQSVGAILDYYEAITGKHLIRDATLGGVAPMSINIKGVSKAETINVIEETLLLNGVVLVQVNETTSKALQMQGGGRNPRNEGVKVYASLDELPKDEQVVTYYMPLSYINPAEAVQVLSQSIPNHAYGQYVPATSAQAVVITDNVSVIRQLVALKELIDIPPAHVVSEFIQLNRADAQTVSDLLNKMLGPQASGPGAAGPSGPVQVPASLGNNTPLSNEHNLLSGTAQIVPVLRSNQLLIVTRPVNMPFLRELVAQLDKADTSVIPRSRPLKYVLAQDIMPALEATVAQGKDEEAQIKQQTSATPNTPGTAPANTGGGGGSFNGGSNGGSSSASNVTPQLSAPTQNNVPTVVSIGKTRLMADNRSNSIIVFGSPDIVARVFDMVDHLDHKPLQVYLSTVIGQLRVTQGQEFGIDLLQKFQRVGQGGFATSNINSPTSLAGSANIPEPATLTSSLGFPLTLGGLNLYGAIGSTLNAYVRALETTGRFKMISHPSVYTTNNTLAVIASGQQIPVPASTTSSFTGGVDNQLATNSSISYQNVLLQLDIIPLINANHEVTLKIRQSNNSVNGSQTISGNNIPIIATQEINTEVTVPDKSTVVIGGLIVDTTNHNTSGVPWLSRIPVLGNLFKDTTKSLERDELIIMIQPTVIETALDQINNDVVQKDRTILGREADQAANGLEANPLEPLPKSITKVTTPTKLEPVAIPSSSTVGPAKADITTGAPTTTPTVP